MRWSHVMLQKSTRLLQYCRLNDCQNTINPFRLKDNFWDYIMFKDYTRY